LKPTIKEKIAFFTPVGFLDGENAQETISSFDVDFLLSTKPEGAFVSLDKVIFFNKRGITLLIESLIRAREINGTIVGFCDYDSKKYNMILEMFQDNLNFSLFDTKEVVSLFLGDSAKDEKKKNILIYTKKSEQNNQLAMELYERGYKPIVAKSREEFLEKKAEAHFTIENSYMGRLDKSLTVFIKGNIVIYTLKGFIDSDISKKFDILYHENSLRVGFKLFVFDASSVSSINVHGANFISKLSTAGAEYDCSIIVCGLDNRNITKNLANDLEDAGVLIYPSMKSLFDDEEMLKEADKSGGVARKHKSINKKLISILPVIAESSIKTIEVLSGYNTKKNFIKVQELELKKDVGLLSASIGFYGAYEGILILSLEKGIAKKACKILLEEDCSEEDILEALGEFMHIVTSKISQQLQKQNIKINITMPRTFSKVEDVIRSQQNSRGAQINLHVEGQDMTLFLAR